MIDAILVQKLRDTESKQNEGRGVQCVKSVLTFLDASMPEEAEAVVNWDHDKLRNYPDIQRILAEMFPEYKGWLQRPGELLCNKGE